MNRPTAAAAILAFSLAGCGVPGGEPAAGPQTEPSDIATASGETAGLPAVVDPKTTASPSTSEPAVAASTELETDDALADACGASRVQPWIGKDSTVPVRKAVAQAAGAASDRWIYPDSVVTQDRQIERLNVEIEKDTNIILRAYCG